ncbi:MAG TPA: hypothetical protein VMI54_19100 [Polyangiaceae bacterium]|nr:hypothetical protein [Polyangiaceae bacterium]
MFLRAARLGLVSSALVAATLAYARPAAAEDDSEPGRDDAAPPPKPDLPPPSARWNVAITGFGVTAGWYAAAVIPSLAWRTGPWAPKLRIPIVGPWMAMPDYRCGGSHHYPCGVPLEIVRGVLSGLDGVGQVSGLAIALESLFIPVRRSDHAGHLEAPHAWVRPVPLVTADTIGLGIVGEL